MLLTSTMETEHGHGRASQIIGDEATNIFILVNYDIINFTIAVFGLVANAMNIIVFFKQGFDSTINISFFGLAISDLCSLITMMWLAICINPYFTTPDLPFVPREVMHLTAGIPHICFVRITGWITVFVTAERCLCITMPLKIKQIITPRVTTITICLIYIAIMLSFVPEYETAYLDWIFYPDKNRTMLGMAVTGNRQNVEGLVFFMYSVLGLASFFAVIILTVILVVQLKQKSKWRSQANVDKARSETITSRDRKTMSMVVMIATVLIVCYTPGVIISMSCFLIPDFGFLKPQVNAFWVSWSFAFIFEAINSSVNIFVYYRMSTKFRETFNDVFRFGKKKELATREQSTVS